MKLGVACDHAAVGLADTIADYLAKAGHEVERSGSKGDSVDYPDVARPVAEAVRAGRLDRAVLVCGTGQGMAISANKVPAVRAAVVSDTFSARMAMLHNDARVLCLGERVVGVSLALACVEAWLESGFEGGRHARRVDKIEGAS